MKLILGAIVLVVGILLGHMDPQPVMCVDPNTNMPIDCSMLR